MQTTTTATTVGATVAGGALGVLATYALGLITGSVPAEVGAALSTLGAFAFGLIFPR